MRKSVQWILLYSLLSFSTVKPVSTTKFVVGATLTAAVGGFIYHIWTNYNVTRTLKRLFTSRCDALEKQLEDIKTNTEQLQTDFLEQKTLLRAIDQADNTTKRMLILLLKMHYLNLSAEQKHIFMPLLQEIDPTLCTEIISH